MASEDPLRSHSVILNRGEDEQLYCMGYRRSLAKSIFSHLMSVLLLFIPYLVGYWRPKWLVNFFRSPSTLFTADSVLIEDPNSDSAEIVDVEILPVSEGSFPDQYIHRSSFDGSPVGSEEANDTTRLWNPTRTSFRFFFYRNAKYVWNATEQTFSRLHGFDRGEMLHRFSAQLRNGLSEEKRSANLLLYGPNTIGVEVKSYLKLLFQEVLNPFYIFQIASIILWSLDTYYYFASCIFLISAVSVIISLIETRRQSVALHNMVAASNNLTVSVHCGQDRFEEIPSALLVPGDVIVVPTGNKLMACDAVLLAGSCIVNESLLTGESVPVTKSPLPYDEESDEIFEIESHKRHTIFAGTTVIQTRCYGSTLALAVVIRTGFSTAKGELIRSIMFPKPMGFKFYKDAIRFVCVLFMVAGIGMMYCIYVYVSRGAPVKQTILRCLDIITIVVPPALPAAMTIGTYHAQNRLKKAGIFCISPQRINICGKLKLVCFDKTGTLTEDGLDLWGVVGTQMVSDSEEGRKNSFLDPERNVELLDDGNNLKMCLALCHSLTTIDGELLGDPLDVKMFQSTGWELDEPGGSSYDGMLVSLVKPGSENSLEVDYENIPLASPQVEIGIIKQFTFSSSLARMSVITRSLTDNHFVIYTKGAPERIEELCEPDTIPKDFSEVLRAYTLRGFRVIGLAYRHLSPEVNLVRIGKMKRDQVEQNLTFLGFLIMQNTLKPQTTPVIAELKKSQIRCVMITGDNILTAISVARDCKIVERGDRIIVVEATVSDEMGGSEPKSSIQFLPTEDGTDATNFASDSDADAETGHLLHRNYHFAISGKSWSIIRNYYQHLLPKLIQHGTIFARMSPEQKGQLVEEFQNIDYIVSFCGDGANDICALKLSHVGISLSEAEASIAAPFTSKIADIRCVPTVIREGRCALVTSFGIFKYMALYSMVQFVSVLLLYTLKTNLGDTQFLYIDLAITTTIAALMGWTTAYTELVPKRPPGSLTTGPNLFSIFSQIFITTIIQVGSFFYLKSMTWYFPSAIENDEEIVLTWETTTIFIVSSFQYLILATVFSKGPPYRKPFYTNKPFLSALVILTLFSIVLSLYPGTALANFFQLMFDPDDPKLTFRLFLMGLVFLNLLACYFMEIVVSESSILKKICHLITAKKEPKNRFKRIEAEMVAENWPDFVLTMDSFSRQPGIS